jgi:phosphoribosylanthranilate isomerase
MTKIKICGITNLSDAIGAVTAGADLLGFNFYPPSPRLISVEKCAQITSILIKEFPSITLVGVFVNMPYHQAREILDICSLHLAQLHGDETPEMLASFNGNGYKAFRGVPNESILKNFASPHPTSAPAFLLDASAQGVYGGSGITTDWIAASLLAKQFRILLAGGLKPENITSALNQVAPWGVDTASGVEIRPGEKDIRKMESFVKAVRSFDLETARPEK